MKNIAENRKASFEYFLEDKFEAGIVLVGSEVKSIRNGSCSLIDTYVQIKGLQYVINFDKFDLKDENESDIDNTIKKIFTAVETHNDDFPLVLKLDEKNIKYKG